MASIMNGLHKALDLFFIPFERLAPFWGMLAISAVTGVLMVIIYKYTSNQEGIASAKERIKGHLLEAWIYREQVGVMLRAQGRVLRANMVYMGHNLKPLAVMIIPVLFLLIHLNFRYGLEPIRAGETTIIKTVRSKPVAFDEMDESLEVPDGVVIETPAMHVVDKGETLWRIRVNRPGTYTLRITAGGKEYEKSLTAGEQGVRVAPLISDSIVDEIFYPGGSAMPDDGPLGTLEIKHGAISPAIPGTNWRPHWIIQYFVLSIIFGFAIKRPLKVEI